MSVESAGTDKAPLNLHYETRVLKASDSASGVAAQPSSKPGNQILKTSDPESGVEAQRNSKPGNPLAAVG